MNPLLRFGGAVAFGSVLAAASGRGAHAQELDFTTLRGALCSSAVPVLLPTRLPAAVGPIHAVSVLNAGRDGYYVSFADAAGCGGALSCAALHVAGYPRRSRAGRAYGADRRFALPGGGRGFYSPRDCSGAGCSEASLTFERGAAVYEIDIKATRDSVRTLVTLANVYRRLACVARRARDCHGR